MLGGFAFAVLRKLKNRQDRDSGEIKIPAWLQISEGKIPTRIRPEAVEKGIIIARQVCSGDILKNERILKKKKTKA